MKKKKKNQKSNMLKEFKEFALKGNIIDMAIGVVIGGAFQKIVNSLVNDIIMPLISILIGKVDFSDMVLTVGNASIKYGSFITTIVDFLIIAFSIFIAIKYFNKLNKIKDISEEMAVKLDKKGNVKKYIKEKKAGRKEKSAEKKKNQTVHSAQFDKNLEKQIQKELKKRERRRKLIVVLASGIAVVCFGYFGFYYFQSTRTGMDYESLAELKGSRTLSQLNMGNDVTVHRTSEDMPEILDEYKTLFEKNKKLIGWLKIDDTIIDYPVMQTSDNKYYLEHNF